MAEHVGILRKARGQMVKARRDVANGLGKPYDGRTTPGLRETFLQLQSVIEAIDRAIEDEESLEGSVYDQEGQ